MTNLQKDIVQAVVEQIKPLRWNGNFVPIPIVAKVMRKNEMAIRMGLRNKTLPIGWCEKGEGDSYIYYVSPKLLYEFTGYIHEPSLLREGEKEAS